MAKCLGVYKTTQTIIYSVVVSLRLNYHTHLGADTFAICKKQVRGWCATLCDHKDTHALSTVTR